MDTQRVWVVKGGNNNELASQVKLKGAVAVGWALTGDISSIRDRGELRSRMESTEPGSGTPGAVGVLFRFAKEIAVGDFVLTPERATREIHITRCSGAYRHDPGCFSEQYPHVLPVEYLGKVSRDFFPLTARNTLGGLQAVFRADNTLPTINAFLKNEQPDLAEEPPEDIFRDLEGQLRGQILEALDNVEHYEFQQLVAGTLRTLGYKATVGPRGKDGGVDVLAHPDEFGLESPRIKVQTKNQRSSAGVVEVGYLLGALAADEKGLFICTGGFTRDASDHHGVKSGRVALVDGDGFLELFLRQYEQLSLEVQTLLPLKRLYAPLPDAER